MTAYYNEIDPFAAQWLRNLIEAGHIAPGDVDERSIEDVRPGDLRGYTQCHFFAGIGVWSHALRAAGWPDSRPVWTGSCPCQPFSAAGKGAGTSDARHLWPAFGYLISECRPAVVLGEQVASPDGLGWWDAVQADLEGEDYACTAFDLCAPGVGAPHIRQRLYWMADDDGEGLDRLSPPRLRGRRPGEVGGESAQGNAHRASGDDADRRGEHGWPGSTNGFWRNADWLGCRDGKWRPVEPGTFPLAHGAPARVGRLRAYGNAIVAPLAQGFIEAVQDTLYPAVDLRLADDIFA